MVIEILRHTPHWVWGLLAALAALGIAQTRDREMSLNRITVLPLTPIALSAFGVWRVSAHSPIALAAWAVGVAAALLFGGRLTAPRGAVWNAVTATLYVPGSMLPLALMMGLFTLKYVVGASLALHPELSATPVFGAACGLAYGSFGGVFLRRGLLLRRLCRPAVERLVLA
jgi:hypothetical protein